jgi:hypothetical protein
MTQLTRCVDLHKETYVSDFCAFQAATCIEVGQRPVYFDIPLGRQSLWISVYYVLLERPNNTEWFYQILTEEMTPGKKLVVISDSEVIATDVDLCNI